MTRESFTEQEILARARRLADAQGPGWDAVMAEEHVGKDTGTLRFWRDQALKELEAETVTSLDLEADTPRTVGLD
ncbi:MAG: hypothetical protein ABWY78_00460 [Microvirga sp.]